MADEHADVAVEHLLQALHAVTVMCRDLEQRVAELAVNLQQRMQARAVLFVDQVGLVQQQQRTNAGVLRRHQVTVDQVGVRFGRGGKDDHDQVDVGRHRLQLAVVVRPAQLGAARHLRDDHANALVARPPYHAVAGNQRRQVGAQVATEHLARGFAVLGFHFYLHTEVRNHQAQLLWPKVATLQFLQHVLFAFTHARRARSGFFRCASSGGD